MFKLLTDEAKQKLQSEYKLRRLVIIVSFIAALLLIGIVGLFPSYIISVTKEHDAKNRMNEINKQLTGNSEEDINTWLSDINTKVKLFAPAADNDKPYEGYAKIISLKPQKVSIVSLGYDKNKGNQVQYSLHGLALDRRSLIEFQNNLNNSPEFKNASVPVSDLAKDSNIDFSLTIDPEK